MMLARSILMQQQCYQLARQRLHIFCGTSPILRRFGQHYSVSNKARLFLLTRSSLLTSHQAALGALPDHLAIKYFATAGSDSESDDESLDNFLSENRDEKDLTETFRQSLYPNSQDPIILQLNDLKTVQEVFSYLHKNQEFLNAEHISQAVLVLWDLQKVFWQVCTDRNPEDNIYELKNYIKAVSGHPDFECLLRLVSKCYEDFNCDALTCTLLYLGKMGVGRTHPVSQMLISRCERELLSFPLTSMSRFLVAVQHGHLWTVSLALPTLPRILEELEICNDPEKLRLLTICFTNAHQLITSSILDTFKQKVQYLLSENIIGASSPRTIVKIIHFLDFPRWSVTNSSLIRDLFLSISGQISELRISDIVSLHRAIQSQLEPASVLGEIQNYVSQLLKDHDPASFPVDVLACIVPFSSIHSNQKLFEDILSVHIQANSFPITMPVLFKILRSLKTSNIQLCDLFWGQVLQNLQKGPRDDYKLMKICHQYMHFNNNLGGTYRHFDFETYMIRWLMKALEGISGVVPTRVARIAAFIMGYGRCSLPPHLVSKIQEMAPQFSCLDCLNLSRGLQIASELRFKSRGVAFNDQVAAINCVLSSCIRSILSSKALNLLEINMLMRSYINMRGVAGTDLFEMLVQKYAAPHKLMSSRLLRDVTFNLVPQRCLVPNAMELMASHVTNNSDALLGDTVEKLLYTSYWLGYSPQDPNFLPAAAKTVVRDCQKMTGLSLLQSALALCLFQHLPLQLSQYIFTVDFLERIDNEIKLCYSKATYPMRLRQMMMELNRAVCLDYPQVDVPWFHSKYCQEKATQDVTPTSSFYSEVHQVLSKVVGGPEFVKKGSYTPYFYKLDYEIVLDEQQKPLPVKEHQHLKDRQVTRIGVLLLREDAFSVGTCQLRGPSLMRRRHLEILNYRQLEVSKNMWQAMYMTEPAAKLAFIQSKIWPHLPTEKAETDAQS